MPRLAVLGHPVSHSRSPAMHSAALEAMGLAGEWTYTAIDVPPEEFEETARELGRRDFAGVNVTVPHKVAALAMSDEATERARAIGAANTLTFAEGRVLADNTDAPGIVDALPSSPRGKRALVMGAGGSARAAIWALREAGAEVNVWNRTREKGEALAKELGVGTDHARPEIIVNATTVGLEEANRDEPLDGRGKPDLKPFSVLADGIQAEVVIDLVYGSRETDLISAARAAGAATVDGIEVLVRQGAISLEGWTGMRPPLEAMRSAARGEHG
jgi:shikimate dehydrogenase